MILLIVDFFQCLLCVSSIQFSCSVMSDSLQPHGLQHTRPPCPSPTPRACSNSCPSSWVFFNESVLCIRWPKYWGFSFSISPSNEYSKCIYCYFSYGHNKYELKTIFYFSVKSRGKQHFQKCIFQSK